MENKKNSFFARYIAAGLVSFILTLVLFADTAMVLVRFGVFSHNGFKSLLREDYYYAVLNDFYTQAEDYTIPTNIDTGVLQGVYTMDEAVRDVNGYIAAAFNGEEYEPDLSGADFRLTSNVNGFFMANDVETDDELEDIVAEYVAEIDELYCGKMKMPGLDLITTYRIRYANLIFIGFCALTLIALGLSLLIVKLFPRAYMGMRFLVYSFGANMLMCGVAPAVLYYSESYLRLSLQPEYFYRFVVLFVKHLLELCLLAALFWLALTALMIVFTALARRSAKKKLVQIQ